jgi:hypothetical protein
MRILMRTGQGRCWRAVGTCISGFGPTAWDGEKQTNWGRETGFEQETTNCHCHPVEVGFYIALITSKSKESGYNQLHNRKNNSNFVDQVFCGLTMLLKFTICIEFHFRQRRNKFCHELKSIYASVQQLYHYHCCKHCTQGKECLSLSHEIAKPVQSADTFFELWTYYLSFGVVEIN